MPKEIDHPDFAVWRALSNEFWPALYFIDARGHIRYHKFGEGDYDQSEAVIQLLLEEAGARVFGPGLSTVHASGLELAADTGSRSLLVHIRLIRVGAIWHWGWQSYAPGRFSSLEVPRFSVVQDHSQGASA